MIVPKAVQTAALLSSNLVANKSTCPWFNTAASNSQDQILYDLVKQYNIPSNNFGATVLALIYSSPLNLYNSAEAVFPTNNINVNSGTISGNSPAPAPNTDVIYAKLSYDLGQQNLVLNFPPYQPGRFYGFAFYDP
jgi:hypothetical protein